MIARRKTFWHRQKSIHVFQVSQVRCHYDHKAQYALPQAKVNLCTPGSSGPLVNDQAEAHGVQSVPTRWRMACNARSPEPLDEARARTQLQESVDAVNALLATVPAAVMAKAQAIVDAVSAPLDEAAPSEQPKQPPAEGAALSAGAASPAAPVEVP
jgi:hypothetical protein